MQVLDYARSTITFELAGVNQARIQVESSCRLDRPGQPPLETWLVASCKAEQTYGPPPLFRSPNYDFCIVYGREQYAIRRIAPTAAGGVAGVVESGQLADRFAAVRYDLVTHPADPLPDAAAVVAAGLANHRLVARHTFGDEATGATATVEYPVKTLNVNPETGRFQTDTGPIALPGPTGWPGDLGGFDVAYAACQDFDRVEWIRQRPLTLPGGDVVHHFHAIDSTPCTTTFWALREAAG